MLQPKVGMGLERCGDFGFPWARLREEGEGRSWSWQLPHVWAEPLEHAGGSERVSSFLLQGRCVEPVPCQSFILLVYSPVTFAWLSVPAAISNSLPVWLQKCDRASSHPQSVPGNTLYSKHTDFGVTLFCCPLCVGMSPCSCPLHGPALLLSSGE